MKRILCTLTNLVGFYDLNMASDGVMNLVFDVGSKFTKAGFAGEASPKVVFPTTVARFRRQELLDGFPVICCGKEALEKRGVSTLTWPVKRGLINNWEEMEKLWHHLFYRGLHVPPEESRIMHSVHPLVPRRDKERMAEILFECFAIDSLYLAKSPALVLHATGRTSGVVWENGFSCSHVTPVFEGFPLKHCNLESPLTGEAMTDYLQKILLDTGYCFTTPTERDLLDKIKAETCFIVQDYEKEMEEVKCAGENQVRYELPDGQYLMLGLQRFQCPELLFQPSLATLDCPNILDTICSSINKCDADHRELFYDNIVLAGGSTMFPGLLDRMRAALTLQLKSLPNINGNIDALTYRNIAAWCGGSIVASLSSLNNFWMTKKEYEEQGVDRVNYKFF